MKIALIGNQNSGKTTLFNLLTGSNQKIGNWPGVTIERKSGYIRGTKIEIVDLPGIYSLNPFSSEEEVSRKFIFEEKPDLIINVVDGTSIERSLYLTTQLLELDANVLVVLNMEDALEKHGIAINKDILAEELGTTIVSISALKKTGIEELINHIKQNDIKINYHKKIFSNELESLIEFSTSFIPTTKINKRFLAVKMLQKDELGVQWINDEIEQKIKKIEEQSSADIEEIIASQRYDYIEVIKKNSVTLKKSEEKSSDKLDKVFLNKFAAIPIFAVIMALIYFLSVGLIGSASVDLVGGWIESFSEWVGNSLLSANANEQVVSLLCDGVIAGVGAILGFIPQLIILFFLLALLETTGYMSRIAFFLDRVFKKFGLSGKSLIPFIVGSGCSVPAIMASRTIEDQDEKKMTVVLVPFIPCNAKLPIIVLFATYFFGAYSWIAAFSLYFFAIVVILLSGLLMKKFVFKSNSSTFISELPEYRIPSPRYVGRDVFDKTWSFVKRAGTIILLCSIVIWLLASYTWNFNYIDGETMTIESSILAHIGRTISWIFYPLLGELNWAATVSAIQGLVAKEQVVSSMAVLNGLAADVDSGNLIFSAGGNFGSFTALSAYSFMVFNLFSAPCFGAIGAMRRELGSARKMLLAVLFQTGLAWLLGALIFSIGSLFLLII